MVDSATDFVWFTDYYGNYLGEIDSPTSTMVKYPLPAASSYPVEIAKQDGTSYLWITEAAGKIARFDMTAHSFQVFTPSVSLSYPVGIVVDKAGNVWISEHGGSSVAEFIQSNSTWRKYPTSQADASPGTGVATLAMDSQGRLWFAEHYSNRIGRLDPATGEMDEFSLPIPGAYSLLDTVDARGDFWFTEATANQIGMITGNATTSVSLRPISVPSASVTASSSTNAEFVITNNNLTSSIVLDLSVTSTFTTNYYTTTSEVSLSKYSLTLGPGQSQNVTAVLTPDFSLSSGTYTAGVVAAYGNVSSLTTVFLRVDGNPWYELETLIPEILIAAGVVLLVVFLVFRQRRIARVRRTSTPVPKTLPAAILSTIFLFTVYETGLAWGKCPGLPPPPGGGPDPYGIALDIGSVAFFAVVAYFLIRSRLRAQSSPSTEQQDQTS
jgi:streptogramin lyase